MMKRRRTPTALDEPEINITALIDVVFVILIMFIIVAPLLDVEKILLAQGAQNSAPAVLNSKPLILTIEVNERGDILFNKMLVKQDALDFVFAQAYKNSPHATLRLFHDSRASFGTYQLIKNATQKSGFEEIELMLYPNPSGFIPK